MRWIEGGTRTTLAARLLAQNRSSGLCGGARIASLLTWTSIAFGKVAVEVELETCFACSSGLGFSGTFHLVDQCQRAQVCWCCDVRQASRQKKCKLLPLST